MAKIPLADLPGSAKVIDHTARYQGVSSDFGMEKSRAILKAADMVTRGSDQLGRMITKYNDDMQQAEDDLAAAEAMADWKKRQTDLAERMKSNPNSAEEFGKWAQDVDDQWQKDVAQYTDRMSDKSKKMFEIQMSVDRNTAVKERTAISNMARVQRLYDGSKNLIEIQLNLNDEAGARATVQKAVDDGVFSQAEGKKYMDSYIPQKMQLLEISNIETSGSADELTSTISKLNKIDSNGHFTDFRNISPEQRRTLVHRLQGRQAQIQNENYEKYVADGAMGKNFSIDTVKKDYEAKKINASAFARITANIQGRNFNNMLNDIENMDVENADMELSGYALVAQQQFEAGEISEKQFNDVNSALKSANINIAKQKVAQYKQQIAINKAKNEYAVNSFMGSVRSAKIPVSLYENLQQKTKVLEDAAKVFGSDLNLLNSVNKEIEKIYNDGLEGKGVFDTPQGKAFKKWFDTQYRTEKGNGIFDVEKLQYDPAFFGDWDSEDFVAYRGYELLQYGADLLSVGLPENKVKELVKEKYDNMTKDRAKKIIQKIKEENTAFANKMKKITPSKKSEKKENE